MAGPTPLPKPQPPAKPSAQTQRSLALLRDQAAARRMAQDPGPKTSPLDDEEEASEPDYYGAQQKESEERAKRLHTYDEEDDTSSGNDDSQMYDESLSDDSQQAISSTSPTQNAPQDANSQAEQVRQQQIQQKQEFLRSQAATMQQGFAQRQLLKAAENEQLLQQAQNVEAKMAKLKQIRNASRASKATQAATVIGLITLFFDINFSLFLRMIKSEGFLIFAPSEDPFETGLYCCLDSCFCLSLFWMCLPLIIVGLIAYCVASPTSCTDLWGTALSILSGSN